MPIGPSILWPVKMRKSAPIACTSVGTWGTYWLPSTASSAPAPCAASASRGMSLSVPSTLDIAVTDTSLAPSSRVSRSRRSRWPSGVTGIQRSSKPFSAESMCQGTMLAWCSISEITTASPGPRLAAPHERASRLNASVAFLVKTTSLVAGALMKRATLARAPSSASVARTARS